MESPAKPGTARAVGVRRARRRAETIEEILALSIEIMGSAGVGGLSFAELARRLGVRPPSLYKYFGSVTVIYDELFGRGQRAHRDAVAAAMASAEPGMASIRAGFEATARFTAEQPVLGQLLFWRRIPGFEPSSEAFAPSVETVELFRRALVEAAARGQLAPEGASEEALLLLSVLAAGISSQYMAHEPGGPRAQSRYLRLVQPALDMFESAYRRGRQDPRGCGTFEGHVPGGLPAEGSADPHVGQGP
jgi:AcrR family transcriptional regulator